MNRRSFLQNGATSGLFGAVLAQPRASGAAAGAPSPTPAIIASYTREDHKRRLENIAYCTFRIRKCLRRHQVTNYIPGHARYDLDRNTWEPTAKNDEALARLKESGIGLIQPWSGWGTVWRDRKIVARNQEGFRRFISLIHKHGMKVIPYTSSFYYERTAPDLNPDYALPVPRDLRGRWAKGSPASPGWRAFTLHRLVAVMDDYEVDGLYDDLGYNRPGEQPNFYGPQAHKLAKDDLVAFEEDRYNDGALGDWLGLLYSEVKRRGGIFKLHKEGTDRCYADFRTYDYLWTGEETREIDWMRNQTKTYEPYLIPQPLIRLGPEGENEGFLHSIPYLQFPILGRGEGGDFRDDYPRLHARWLKLYQPMVEDGSWVWMEIADSDLFPENLPRNVVASVFANRELYMVLANYRRAPVEVETADEWTPVEAAAAPRKRWTLEPRSLQFLRRPSAV